LLQSTFTNGGRRFCTGITLVLLSSAASVQRIMLPIFALVTSVNIILTGISYDNDGIATAIREDNKK
jgi:hypothetical protein